MEHAPKEESAHASNQARFRVEAMKAHQQARKAPGAPQFVGRRTLLRLWGSALFLLGSLLGLGLWRVPAFASGVGVVVAEGGGLALVALFPPEEQTRLVAGQRLVVRAESAEVHPESRIVEVERTVLSPEAAVRRFGLPAGATRALEGPVVCARAAFQAPSPGLSPRVLPGSTWRVEAEVGRQRLLSLVPFVGRFFES